METVEDYVRKNGIGDLLDEIEKIRDGSVEQHEIVKNSKVSVEDWFEFVWELNDSISNHNKVLPVVDFDYLAVEDVAVEYVKNNSPVSEDDLVSHVSSNVESADEDDVSGWLFNITVDTMETDENDMIIDLNRSFDESVYN